MCRLMIYLCLIVNLELKRLTIVAKSDLISWCKPYSSVLDPHFVNIGSLSCIQVLDNKTVFWLTVLHHTMLVIHTWKLKENEKQRKIRERPFKWL